MYVRVYVLSQIYPILEVQFYINGNESSEDVLRT